MLLPLLLVESALALALSLGIYSRTKKCSLCRDFIVLSHFKAEIFKLQFSYFYRMRTPLSELEDTSE